MSVLQLDQRSLAAKARSIRDQRIKDIEWRIERHASEERQGITPTDDITELDAYVQALREVPQQPDFPQSINWPAKPE